MTALDLLATAAAPQRLDPLELFLMADIVVQAVMAGLVLASVWVWAVIVAFPLRMGGVRRRCDAYEADFWKARDFEAFQAERGKGDLPVAKVAAAALGEWRRSISAKALDRDGLRQRLATVMDSTIAQESDRLAERLNFLATVGSVAPFVGLFGTVWGIMRSFTAIAAEQNSSLAVVAPGIAEALFATAIGLFAAIPAVIAYNRFSHRLNKLEGKLFRFSDAFHGELSRELEKDSF